MPAVLLVSAMPAVLALPSPRHSRTRLSVYDPGLLRRLPRESPEVTEHEFPVATCLCQGVRGPLPFCLCQGSGTRNRRICSVPHSLANVAESLVCCYGLSLSLSLPLPLSLSLSPRLSPLDRARCGNNNDEQTYDTKGSTFRQGASRWALERLCSSAWEMKLGNCD